MSDHSVFIVEVSFNLHSVVLSTIYNLETMNDMLFLTHGWVDMLYNPGCQLYVFTYQAMPLTNI